jgi:hypothetical protein
MHEVAIVFFGEYLSWPPAATPHGLFTSQSARWYQPLGGAVRREISMVSSPAENATRLKDGDYPLAIYTAEEDQSFCRACWITRSTPWYLRGRPPLQEANWCLWGQ